MTTPNFLADLPTGRAGVQRTLRMMAALTRRGRTEMPVRELALRLVAGLRPKDYGAEIRRLHAYVRDAIRYVRDVRGVETLHTASRVLEQGQGDCDDKSVLLASLLESIGHRTRFTAVGFVPGRLSHVLPEVKLGRVWLPLETIVAGALPGWVPPGIVERMTVDV
jgi:transglutaminase-like putative cysteine protease